VIFKRKPKNIEEAAPNTMTQANPGIALSGRAFYGIII
jgi:hypothetical protein